MLLTMPLRHYSHLHNDGGIRNPGTLLARSDVFEMLRNRKLELSSPNPRTEPATRVAVMGLI